MSPAGLTGRPPRAQIRFVAPATPRWLLDALRVARRRALPATIALVTALAALSTAGSRGWVWLWCEPMGEARFHCCCPEDPDAGETTTISRRCCEPRVGEGLPVLTIDERRGDPLASVIGPGLPLPRHPQCALPHELDARAPCVAPRPWSSARAGPRARVHALVSVYLV